MTLNYLKNVEDLLCERGRAGHDIGGSCGSNSLQKCGSKFTNLYEALYMRIAS